MSRESTDEDAATNDDAADVEDELNMGFPLEYDSIFAIDADDEDDDDDGAGDDDNVEIDEDEVNECNMLCSI